MRLAAGLAVTAGLVAVPFAGAYAAHRSSTPPARAAKDVAAAAVVEKPLPASGPAPQVRTLERAAALPAIRVKRRSRPKRTPTPTPTASATPTATATPYQPPVPTPTVVVPTATPDGGDGPTGGGGSG